MASSPLPSPSPTPPPPQPTTKPVLQKPPGYRDPTTQPPFPPPRKPALPPSLRPKRKRRGGFCRICCCTFFILILILIFAAVVAAGLIYILYDPSLPEFHLASFRVPNLNVTSKPDGVYLDADTAARVEVKNRSGKMKWYFEETKVDVSAENGDVNLGSTVVPSCEVKEKEKKELKAETKVRDMALDEKQMKKLKGKELVPNVEVRTRTGVGVQGWKSWKVGISVVCGDVSMKKLENGDTPTCTLTTLKWIKIRF